MEVYGQLYSRPFYPRENTGTRSEGYWVGPSAGSGFMEERNICCACLRWESLSKEKAVNVSVTLGCL